MLLLNAAADTEEVMEQFDGVVLPDCDADPEKRKRYFVRLANDRDEIVDLILCHFLGNRIAFREHKPEQNWYEGEHFEGAWNSLRIRIGFANPIRSGFYILHVHENGQDVFSAAHPQEVIKALYWAIKEKLGYPIWAPPEPVGEYKQKQLDKKREEQNKVDRVKELLRTVPVS